MVEPLPVLETTLEHRPLPHPHRPRPIARTYGTISWRQGLYAPTALPEITRWGPLVECIGRRIAPRRAAFEVLTITLPERPAETVGLPPLVTAIDHDEPSVFQVENLIREARRQRHLGSTPVPTVCLLDPDGDVVRHLEPLGRATRHTDWACYHSELWATHHDGLEIGIVPCAVGAPATMPEHLAELVDGAFDELGEPVHAGDSWTTDAPFRETATAIERARAVGVHAVEMEAAAPVRLRPRPTA